MATVTTYAEALLADLKKAGIRASFDARDQYKPGFKFAEHEVRGVPLRVAVGPRDVENGTVELARRDTREKTGVAASSLTEVVRTTLDQIQTGLFRQAVARREAMTHYVDSYEAFKQVLDEQGGFIYAHWDGSPETEARIKEETKATIRCIPLAPDTQSGTCMVTGKSSARRVLFARAY